MLKFIRALAGGLILSVGLSMSAMAAGTDVNATSTGLALRGYDPVAYFTDKKPVRGSFKITASHNGATYRFASEENKARFTANPKAYVPAYGGYCAFGTAMGFKVDGDPNVWKVVDNKLYLNLAASVQKRWESEQAEFIKKADGKWVVIKDKAPSELK